MFHKFLFISRIETNEREKEKQTTTINAINVYANARNKLDDETFIFAYESVVQM